MFFFFFFGQNNVVVFVFECYVIVNAKIEKIKIKRYSFSLIRSGVSSLVNLRLNCWVILTEMVNAVKNQKKGDYGALG